MNTKIIVALLLVTSSFSGCIFFNNTTVFLVSSVVYDDNGFASLLLNFNASDMVTLKLSNPKNITLFSDTFYSPSILRPYYFHFVIFKFIDQQPAVSAAAAAVSVPQKSHSVQDQRLHSGIPAPVSDRDSSNTPFAGVAPLSRYSMVFAT